VNVLIGEAFASTAQAAIAQANVEPDLVASHGQTLWHQVAPGHTRSTLQLGEPSVIAERLGVTTVADFRPRDIAAGGQGAPSAGTIVATLTAFTAHSIADQYRRFLPGRPDEVVVGGGGSRNPVLMGLLTELLDPAQLRMHEDFGLPSVGREAVFFALIGHEALFGRPN